MSEQQQHLEFTLRPGQRIEVTLPDGRKGWVAVKRRQSHGDQVSVRIEFDRDVPIYRAELLGRLQALRPGRRRKGGC